MGALKQAVSRRNIIGAIVASIMGLFAGFFGKRRGRARAGGLVLRPPGALPEPKFTEACVRCFKCGNACPNGCIKFHGIGSGLANMFTPYIQARDRGCVLCGECTKVCPTGALTPFEATREGWIAGVDMGLARVNKSMCYSYHGRTCGACYRACPLAGQAMKIGVFETPIVQAE